MRRLLLLNAWRAQAALVASLGTVASGHATTYFVRTDGGSAQECTGLADAAYPGRGSGRACAWSHPFIALPPTNNEHHVAPRIKGGDTLMVGLGSYELGFGAPETSVCYANYPTDCHMQPIPAGPDPGHVTRVLGVGWDHGCAKPPEWWGSHAAHRLVDMTGSSNVELGCLELTDHSSCIVNQCSAGNCTGGPAQLDRCGDDDVNYAQNGLWSTDAANVSLHDMDIHGLGGEGVRAGRMADWHVERVRIWANGFAGWDADVSNGRVDPTSSSGTLYFSKLEIAWSGCGERYPGREIFGCWGQEEGGYGDGFSTGASGGRWIFEDSYVHNNTQDGLDLLYVGDGRVEMRRVRADSNAGNQIKVNADALIEGADVNGDCASFRGVGNMQEGDQCRADGAAIAVALADGKRSVVANSRVTGEGGCLIVGSGGGNQSLLVLHDNTLTGKPRWNDKSTLTCGFYLYQSQGRVEALDNRIEHVKASATMNDVCASSTQGSLLDATCKQARSLYRAIHD